MGKIPRQPTNAEIAEAEANEKKHDEQRDIIGIGAADNVPEALRMDNNRPRSDDDYR